MRGTGVDFGGSGGHSGQVHPARRRQADFRGQLGAAVVRALAAEPSRAEVQMANRKAISQTADPRVRQVILDTAATQFPAAVIKVAQSMIAQGDPVYGASCVGVGKGSRK